MANLSSTFTLNKLGDRELVITRMFDAPRELVFKACSSCEHLGKWLGPRDMTMVSCEMDFRAGGKYRYVQRAADGVDYAFKGDIREIVPPERIVQTFEFELMPGHISEETLTLEELDGKTKLMVTSRFDSVDDRDGIIQSGMEVGARQSYDRLEEYISTIA